MRKRVPPEWDMPGQFYLTAATSASSDKMFAPCWSSTIRQEAASKRTFLPLAETSRAQAGMRQIFVKIGPVKAEMTDLNVIQLFRVLAA